MKQEIKRGEMKRKVKKPVPSQKDVEEINKEDSLLDRIESELEKDGIVMFNNDTVDVDYLQLPAHLDSAPSNELGRYLHTFTQQKIWARTLRERVKILMRDENEKLITTKERIFSAQPLKMSITEKELKLYSDPNAVPILERLKLIEEKYSMLSSYIENLVDGIFDISREISRREGDFGESSRLESVNNKRRKR